MQYNGRMKTKPLTFEQENKIVMLVIKDAMAMKIFLSLIFLLLIFPSASFSENYKFQKLVDLKNPWGSSFINNNELIVTEKSGKIKVVNINSKKVSEIEHNLNFLVDGQGGLLDILYKDNLIWISYTENRGNSKTSTSIAKAKLNKKVLKF